MLEAPSIRMRKNLLVYQDLVLALSSHWTQPSCLNPASQPLKHDFPPTFLHCWSLTQLWTWAALVLILASTSFYFIFSNFLVCVRLASLILVTSFIGLRLNLLDYPWHLAMMDEHTAGSYNVLTTSEGLLNKGLQMEGILVTYLFQATGLGKNKVRSHIAHLQTIFSIM